MSTVEDFENAPIGATATSPNGNMAFKNGRRTFEWFIFDSRGRPCDNLHNDEMGGYTLNPVAPTTASEALELVWNLAHPIKDGQQVDVGTRCIAKVKEGDLRTYKVLKPFIGGGMQGWAEVRTLDPLPEPDWLDAPAVIATTIGNDNHRTFANVGNSRWHAVGDKSYPWTDLTDVTPLYPKEEA